MKIRKTSYCKALQYPQHVFALPIQKIDPFREPATNFHLVLEKSEKHSFGAQYSV